jgi:hypothetical protein
MHGVGNATDLKDSKNGQRLFAHSIKYFYLYTLKMKEP